MEDAPAKALSLSLGNPVLYATNQRPSNKSNTCNLVPHLTSSHSKLKIGKPTHSSSSNSKMGFFIVNFKTRQGIPC